MSEWKKMKLGDFISLQRGYDLTREQFVLGPYPVVSSTTIMGYHNQFKAQAPGVVIGRSGTLGEVQYLTDNYWPHNTALFVKDFKGNIPRYVYYFLRYFGTETAGGGAAVPTLNRNSLSILDINVPDCPIQHRIATILSRYDTLIENYQKQIKLLEEAAQRLYKEWFVDLRFPGYENIKVVDGLPEGWERKTVGEVTPIKTGKKDANFGTDNGEYPFFTCAQEPIKAPSYSFDTSAVILAGNGDFNVKLYRGKFEAYQRTYVLEPDNAKMLYLLYFCISENMNKLATGASGSTIKFLTKGMIESLNIFAPSMMIVDAFNKVVEPIQSNKEYIQSQTRLLTEARDRLLPKLMNGELLQ